MPDKKTYRKEISLNGKMITGDDPAKVGENFQSLVNMRYKKNRPVGIGGMTKINTTALTTYTKVRSGIHYRKDQPSESHILVEARDASDNAKIYDNTTAVPSAGDFSGTALFTPTTGASVGRWSVLPDGDVGYCNGEESCVWGGNEREVAGFVNYDPGGAFSYDYTDHVRNTLDDSANIATLNPVSGGIDSNTMLLLHLDNDVADATSDHTPTNNNVTFTTTGALDGYRGVFTTDAYISITDDADFNLSGGKFTIDCHLELDDLNSDYSIYYQNTLNDNDSFNIIITTDGRVLLRIKASATKVFSGASDFQTDDGVISSGTVYHIAVVENDDDWFIFVDGVLKGHTNDAARAANYTGDIQIGYDGTTYIEGKIDEFNVSNIARYTNDFEVPTSPYSASSEKCYIYLGAIRPLKGFKFYSETANTQTSTMSVWYWNGTTWTSVSSLSDGTSSGGKSLAQTGSVTFTSTAATAKLKYIDEVYLYWYKIYVNVISANTAVSYVTVDTPFQDILDIWDGVPVQVDFAQKKKDAGYKDITLQVRENEYTSTDHATFADFDDLETDEYLLFGFYERMNGLHFHFVSGKENNKDNTVATVSYWNGTAWTSVGTIDDGTKKNSRSFGSSGVMSWSQIDSSLEFTTNVNNDYQLYYYKVSFSKSLDSDDDELYCFYVTGIRAQKEISAYKFPLHANDRTWLCCDMKEKKNKVIYSAQDTSHVFNGDDSGEYKFGDETELTGGAWLYSQYGSSIYNIVLFFKEGETWAIVGNNPEDWTKFRLSKTIGCPDPETIRVIDINTANSNKSVAVWRADDGIYMSDGRPPVLLSDDISDVFDKRDSNAISTSVEAKSFWDNNEKEYHFLWAQGSSTTQDKEYVLNFKKPGWFEISRTSGKELQYGIECQTTTGRNYTYGFIDTGYMLRLENGTAFDGEDITHTLRFGDIALAEGQVSIETRVEHHGVVAVAKSNTTNTIAITHYGDGESSGTSWTESSNKSGYRLLEPVYHKHTDNHVFHSWKLVMTTDDETVGFEPLYFYVLYSVTPPGHHMRDRRP